MDSNIEDVVYGAQRHPALFGRLSGVNLFTGEFEGQQIMSARLQHMNLFGTWFAQDQNMSFLPGGQAVLVGEQLGQAGPVDGQELQGWIDHPFFDDLGNRRWICFQQVTGVFDSRQIGKIRIAAADLRVLLKIVWKLKRVKFRHAYGEQGRAERIDRG